MQPKSLSPKLQSFIYKTYCLSQFTYSLETSVLNKDTRDYLNICQNNILRQILGLNKNCYTSNILKCLRLYSFEDSYFSSKLSFLNSIKQNKITSNIFSYLCKTERNRLYTRYKSSRKKILLRHRGYLSGMYVTKDDSQEVLYFEEWDH